EPAVRVRLAGQLRSGLAGEDLGPEPHVAQQGSHLDGVGPDGVPGGERRDELMDRLGPQLARTPTTAKVAGPSGRWSRWTSARSKPPSASRCLHVSACRGRPGLRSATATGTARVQASGLVPSTTRMPSGGNLALT